VCFAEQLLHLLVIHENTIWPVNHVMLELKKQTNI